MAVRFTQLYGMTIFQQKYFTATSLRCGGIFNYFFARNLLLSLPLKEF